MTASVLWAFARTKYSAEVTPDGEEQEEACDAQGPQIKPHRSQCILFVTANPKSSPNQTKTWLTPNSSQINAYLAVYSPLTQHTVDTISHTTLGCLKTFLPLAAYCCLCQQKHFIRASWSIFSEPKMLPPADRNVRIWAQEEKVSQAGGEGKGEKCT